MTEDKNDNLRAEQPICFVPTPVELAVLVKHWANEVIKDEYFAFWSQCFSSPIVQRIDRNWNRVEEIAEVLGDEATHTAVEETYQHTAQNFDRNDWIVFRIGTQEELDAYRKIGGPFLEEFDSGVAHRLASQVVERVFREERRNNRFAFSKRICSGMRPLFTA